ncbi:MAG: Tm-1-like ATP-binding domain-containing protein [Pirellulaceae bacterium]
MSLALTKFLVREQELGKVAGAIGIGGSGGTSLIAAAAEALPIGLRSSHRLDGSDGNTALYVSMQRHHADVLGRRRGWIECCLAYSATPRMRWPAWWLTLREMSTPSQRLASSPLPQYWLRVRESLTALGYDGLVFHATISGGQAMES